MPEYDVIIIGSGPAGCHSAYPIVATGAKVLMICGGHSEPDYMRDAPSENFEDIRHENRNQYRWFLGEDFSSIPLHGLQGGLGGGQISGNRAYVVRDTEEHLPLILKNAQVIQSLAKGGLGAAWGGTCAYLEEQELQAMGLPSNMEKYYDIITQRIGISGPIKRKYIQPPARLDHHARAIIQTYKKKEKCLYEKNITVEQPYTALLTQNLGHRRETKYADMDYWIDPEKAIYRPQYSVDELIKSQNFFYAGGYIVQSVKEKANICTVTAISQRGEKEEKSFTTKKVILAAGAVNSARILLSSLNMYDAKIPFVGKPHMFAACMHWKMLGTCGEKERTSLCQLVMYDKKKDHALDASYTQLYSYRSLQIFRIISVLPLPVPQAMNLARILAPLLIIADIRFPGRREEKNTLLLQKDKTLSIEMTRSKEEQEERKRSAKKITRSLRILGLHCIKKITLPEASTSHYAGTIPFCSNASEEKLSTDKDGKLHQGKNIWVADASVFRCLSAKPHTLTIMANAQRIGEAIVQSMK